MRDERLSALIEGYLDAQLTESERSELEETLCGSAAARAQFWQDTRLHGLLHEAERADTGDSVGTPRLGEASPRRLSRFAVALACAFLLAAAGWWWRGRTPLHRAASDMPAIVGLLTTTPDARWAREPPPPLLQAGRFELSHGVAGIALACGAKLAVQAPATFTVESADRVTLAAGRLRADVAGTPLTVQTPAGAWTARDASFGVAARAGVVEAHAFHGTLAQRDTLPLTAPAAIRHASGKRTPAAANQRSFPDIARASALPIAAGDFEHIDLTRDNVPQEFGAWSGDEVAAVAAEQGIKPLSGEHMLRFLRAAPRAARNEPALAGC